MTSYDVENLGGTIASSSNILSVMTESNTAHDTLVLESVEKIHIQYARNLGVEDREPIGLDLLLVCWETLKIQFCQSISDSELVVLIWHWVANLWGLGSPWVWIWHWLI